MATKKKLLQAAAGNAGGAAALNVEDVFSTYLYEGNGASQSIENGIALGDFGLGTSTEFDGTNDYLSRSSDLTGNADGKTFTFSAWAYLDKNILADNFVYGVSNGTTNSAAVSFTTASGSAGYVNGNFYNASGTRILQISASTGYIPNKTWAHVLISVDLTDTAKRYIYVNDVEATSVAWPIYTNDNINFTNSQHVLGAVRSAVAPFDGRLAHVYLDYTYRDLSVEANRRDFIDANGGSTAPSTLSALSPILYLPMTEDYSIGENLGTGGDFTSNGSPTIVQSGTEYEDGYGEGGLVWTKCRNLAQAHVLQDSERGLPYRIFSALTNAQDSNGSISSFNSNGYTLSTPTAAQNDVGGNYASWTFRKAPKFFDVVTYTGTGSAQSISHNLGSVPGCIFVKRTDTTANWSVYHKDIANTQALYLNLTNGAATSTSFNGTATDSVFYVDSSVNTNASGGSYVAYLFAHNDGDGGFGPDGDADIIKCGSYTATNSDSTAPEINLGFEPQYLLVKNATSAHNWYVLDTMRGIPSGGTYSYLNPNLSDAEATDSPSTELTATGFIPQNRLNFGNGNTYIYIAIRRGPMAVPESATDVFAIDTQTSGSPSCTSGFVTDAATRCFKTSDSSYPQLSARLMQGKYLITSGNLSERTLSSWEWDMMDGYGDNIGGTSTNIISHMWKRAPNFFDVVTYKGDGVVGRTVSHNLGVAPEMMWIKDRNNINDWYVYSSYTFGDDGDDLLRLGSISGAGTSNILLNNTAPTSTVFTLADYTATNGSGRNYIAYLFASLDGISKLGSYTGNGSSQTIDCGFSSGARFVLIKRTDDTSDWYVWDTVHGIVTNNPDPYFGLNTITGEVIGTNWVDPDNSGFIVQDTTINASSATYIFYAIA